MPLELGPAAGRTFGIWTVACSRRKPLSGPRQLRERRRALSFDCPLRSRTVENKATSTGRARFFVHSRLLQCRDVCNRPFEVFVRLRSAHTLARYYSSSSSSPVLAAFAAAIIFSACI